MKVQIITLDPDDDHFSVRDKLSWARGSKAVLVWPRRGRVLRRRLDLVLLLRHVRRYGIQLGLIAFDEQIRRNAAELGIPVFEDLEGLTAGPWGPFASSGLPIADRPRERAKPIPTERRRLASMDGRSLSRPVRVIVFSLAVSAVLAMGAMILPSAEIVVSPEVRSEVFEVHVVLDPQATSLKADGHLPAKTVSTVVQGGRSRPASGMIFMPTKAATGEVVFRNLTSEAVLIPAGTGVSTSGTTSVRFETLEAVELPAETGASVEVRVQSVEPGFEGNLPPHSLEAIDGSLGLVVSATNPEATRGGLNEWRHTASASDQAGLRRALTRDLIDEAAEELEASLPAGEVLVFESLRIAEELGADLEPPIGALTETVNLDLTIEVAALSYRQSDLRQTLLMAISLGLPDGREPLPPSIDIEKVSWSGEPDGVSAGGLEVRGRLETYRVVPFAKVRHRVRGLEVSEAIDDLATWLSLSEPPMIRLYPAWVPRLPWLETRITTHLVWETER